MPSNNDSEDRIVTQEEKDLNKQGYTVEKDKIDGTKQVKDETGKVTGQIVDKDKILESIQPYQEGYLATLNESTGGALTKDSLLEVLEKKIIEFGFGSKDNLTLDEASMLISISLFSMAVDYSKQINGVVINISDGTRDEAESIRQQQLMGVELSPEDFEYISQFDLKTDKQVLNESVQLLNEEINNNQELREKMGQEGINKYYEDLSNILKNIEAKNEIKNENEETSTLRDDVLFEDLDNEHKDALKNNNWLDSKTRNKADIIKIRDMTDDKYIDAMQYHEKEYFEILEKKITKDHSTFLDVTRDILSKDIDNKYVADNIETVLTYAGKMFESDKIASKDKEKILQYLDIKKVKDSNGEHTECTFKKDIDDNKIRIAVGMLFEVDKQIVANDPQIIEYVCKIRRQKLLDGEIDTFPGETRFVMSSYSKLSKDFQREYIIKRYGSKFKNYEKTGCKSVEELLDKCNGDPKEAFRQIVLSTGENEDQRFDIKENFDKYIENSARDNVTAIGKELFVQRSYKYKKWGLEGITDREFLESMLEKVNMESPEKGNNQRKEYHELKDKVGSQLLIKSPKDYVEIALGKIYSDSNLSEDEKQEKIDDVKKRYPKEFDKLSKDEGACKNRYGNYKRASILYKGLEMLNGNAQKLDSTLSKEEKTEIIYENMMAGVAFMYKAFETSENGDDVEYKSGKGEFDNLMGTYREQIYQYVSAQFNQALIHYKIPKEERSFLDRDEYGDFDIKDGEDAEKYDKFMNGFLEQHFSKGKEDKAPIDLLYGRIKGDSVDTFLEQYENMEENDYYWSAANNHVTKDNKHEILSRRQIIDGVAKMGNGFLAYLKGEEIKAEELQRYTVGEDAFNRLDREVEKAQEGNKKAVQDQTIDNPYRDTI